MPRRAWRIARLAVHVGWGVLLAVLAFPLFGKARRDRVIRDWSRRLLAILGVRPDLGTPPAVAGGALLVANHVSWLDIYLIYAAVPVHFVSKAEVRDWPVAGWLAEKTGTLFLDRGRRADTARINAVMHERIRAGAWVAVFPEGTTSDGRGLKPFRPPLLQPAVELGCPVVPAAIRYRTLDGRPALAAAYIDDMSLWQSLMQIAAEPGLIAELRFGEPIAASGHRRELAARAENAVRRLLGISSADTPPETPGGRRGEPPSAARPTDSRYPAQPGRGG